MLLVIEAANLASALKIAVDILPAFMEMPDRSVGTAFRADCP